MARSRSRADKPNILVIWGDDIGISNLSCYSHGLMGYQTPNIDRLAKEGMMFTDSYGEQSCTAGRASFITGQSGYRTGLTKVGVPGSPVGLKAEDATWALEDWAPRVIAAGWRFWGVVMPEKVLGQMNMKRWIATYEEKGVTVSAFAEPLSAMSWLEQQKS